MSSAISSNEAKQRWGSLLSAVSDDGEEIVLESHGKPRAVLVPFAAYQEFQALREQKRRADILDRLRALQEQIGNRNQDLTEEQAAELANRFAHEFIDDLADEGKLIFERDQH